MQKKIAVISGDGIGPEVMKETVRVLKAIAQKFNHEFLFNELLAGGAAWDDYGCHLPEETLEGCRKADAILFGSIGERASMQKDPKWRNAEQTAILGLRKEFGLSINLRPVKVYSQLKNISPLKSEILGKGIDILIVRELTSGIYFSKPRYIKEDKTGKIAVDTMSYNTEQIRKVAKVAFEAARKRKKKLTSVDKANVLDCSRLWREVVEKMHTEEYFDIELDHMLVDNVAMRLITMPSQFDVILTSNLFGDILSDEAAALVGSLGLMPSSANGEKISMYEPIGGSAPDIAGQGIANPVAQIMSGAMLLKYSFGLNDEYDAIDQAINQVFKDGYRTGDIMEEGMIKIGTEKMGDMILEKLLMYN